MNCSFCGTFVLWGKKLADGRILCRACEVCIFFETRLTLTADYAGKPFTLMPWVKEVLRDLFGTLDEEGNRRYRDVYLEVPKKNTKALALDTPIPTPSGWTTIGAVAVGDKVLARDGNVVMVTHVSDVFMNRPCYELKFSNGERVIADAEHLWETTALIDIPGRRSRAGIRHSGMVLTQKEARTTVRTTEQIYATQRAGRLSVCNHRLKLPEPLNLPEAVLPIEPYVL